MLFKFILYNELLKYVKNDNGYSYGNNLIWLDYLNKNTKRCSKTLNPCFTEIFLGAMMMYTTRKFR